MLPLLEAPASIFLTYFGQFFMLLFLFFSLIYSVGELALFSIILLTMGLGAYLWSRAGLKHVECEIALNRVRLFPGEKVKIAIRTVNSKLLPVLIKIDLFATAAITGSDQGQWISEETGLLWYQQAVFSREFFPQKRGVYSLGPPMLRGGDLLGFFFKEKTATDRRELVVYPRIIDIRRISLLKRGFYGTPGSRSPMEDPIYIFGTRDYQPSRPARGIHWKASARHHRLQEKLCEPAQQEKVLILLDVGQFEKESEVEDFEKTLEVLASLVLQLDRRGIALGLVTNGRILGSGPKIVQISASPLKTAAILETLARVGPEKTGSILEILARGYPMPWGVTSLYFTCNKTDEIRAARLFMKQRNIPIRFILSKNKYGSETASDPREEQIFHLADIVAPEKQKK